MNSHSYKYGKKIGIQFFSTSQVFHPIPSSSIRRTNWRVCQTLARHWDPLTMSYGGGAGLPSDAIELPTELMMMPGASSGGIL